MLSGSTPNLPKSRSTSCFVAARFSSSNQYLQSFRRTRVRKIWSLLYFETGRLPPRLLLSKMSVTRALSFPQRIRSLSFLERSVDDCPSPTEMAKRSEDFPAPLGDR